MKKTKFTVKSLAFARLFNFGKLYKQPSERANFRYGNDDIERNILILGRIISDTEAEKNSSDQLLSY
ncbi:MAG: hypothetical protein FDX30_12315 [Chlorobium sp.]|nr:MAG: hypothetical protein FDX30_12315 [Chlorobium sp.]